MSTDYEHLLIGSGAGGLAAAYALSRGKGRVLLIEKGSALKVDGSIRRRVCRFHPTLTL